MFSGVTGTTSGSGWVSGTVSWAGSVGVTVSGSTASLSFSSVSGAAGTSDSLATTSLSASISGAANYSWLEIIYQILRSTTSTGVSVVSTTGVSSTVVGAASTTGVSAEDLNIKKDSSILVVCSGAGTSVVAGSVSAKVWGTLKTKRVMPKGG